MKHVRVLFLVALVLALVVAACGGEPAPAPTSAPEPTKAPEPEPAKPEVSFEVRPWRRPWLATMLARK